MSKSWRDVAAPVIAKVLSENAHRTDKEVRDALFAAYPFGERKYHPYKIWLDEIQRQRGLKKAKRPLANVHEADPDQLNLTDIYGSIDV